MGTVGVVGAAVLTEDTAARFPAAPYASASGYFETYAVEAGRAARIVEPGALDRAVAVLVYQRVLSHDSRPKPSSVICEYLSCQSTRLRATVSPSTL